MAVVSLNKTLEQELFALARGASLECLACGEFVLHEPAGAIACPECGSRVETRGAGSVRVRIDDAKAG